MTAVRRNIQPVAEAAGLVREFGDDAAYYAGGTELLIVLNPDFSIRLTLLRGEILEPLADDD